MLLLCTRLFVASTRNYLAAGPVTKVANSFKKLALGLDNLTRKGYSNTRESLFHNILGEANANHSTTYSRD